MKNNNKFIPEGIYCYKILEVMDNGMGGIKVKYCDYRDSHKTNRCGELYCKYTKHYIEDDCKHCGLNYPEL
jgi:hypothetical protein